MTFSWAFSNLSLFSSADGITTIYSWTNFVHWWKLRCAWKLREMEVSKWTLSCKKIVQGPKCNFRLRVKQLEPRYSEVEVTMVRVKDNQQQPTCAVNLSRITWCLHDQRTLVGRDTSFCSLYPTTWASTTRNVLRIKWSRLVKSFNLTRRSLSVTKNSSRVCGDSQSFRSHFFQRSYSAATGLTWGNISTFVFSQLGSHSVSYAFRNCTLKYISSISSINV